MTYDEVLNKIHGCRRFGAAPGLFRIQGLMDALGNPEKSLNFIHIVGTNGKGSTAAMIESALRLKGLKTGLFTSPYLVNFRERIQICGQMITPDELIEYAGPVLELAESAEDRPTEFDVVTAIALCYFAAKGCDMVVFEVGLGGRYDPTNVIPVPSAAVITHIALDHTQQLGDTIAKIAYEKAGIIKRGGPVILSCNQEPEAVQVIETECEKVESAALVKAGEPQDVMLTPSFTNFSYKDRAYELSLIGRHQAENATAAIEVLATLGLNYDEVYTGLKAARWPGRLELIPDEPKILIDAAHNPDGLMALVDALDSIFKPSRVISIVAMMSDKDWQASVKMIAQKSAALYAVTTGEARALPPSELAEYARKYCPNVTVLENVKAALQAAKALYKDGDLVVICGSIVLAGQVKQITNN